MRSNSSKRKGVNGDGDRLRSPAVVESDVDSSVFKKGTLLERMERRLHGSRFRWLNEKLYNSTGTDALVQWGEDSTLFEAYHRGFSQQIKQWSMNPLDIIIKDIRKKDIGGKILCIADMGCGEGRLGCVLGGEDNFQVSSFDLVSCGPGIIATDMSNVPLENGSMDIVVFCLSLMGTNWPDFVAEGTRILRFK